MEELGAHVAVRGGIDPLAATGTDRRIILTDNGILGGKHQQEMVEVVAGRASMAA